MISGLMLNLGTFGFQDLNFLVKLTLLIELIDKLVLGTCVLVGGIYSGFLCVIFCRSNSPTEFTIRKSRF